MARKRRVRRDSAPPKVPDVAPARPRGTTAITRRDSYANALTGLGTNRDKRIGGYVTFALMGYQEAEDLWRGDDMAAKMIEEPAREMTRKWLDVQIEPPKGEKDPAKAKDASEATEKALSRLNAKARLREGIMKQRAFGGAAILLGARDGNDDIGEPLDEKKLESIDFLTVFDAWECYPRSYYTNADEEKYGQPETYWVYPQGVPGTAFEAVKPTRNNVNVVHESRILRLQGVAVSRRAAAQNRGWPDSTLVRVRQVLADFGMSWDGTAHLLQDFSQAVFRMRGLAEASAAGSEGEQLIRKRLEDVELGRSLLRAIVLDAGTGEGEPMEEFERKATPVTGLAELLDRFCNRLAAAADMPVTRLMGQSPAGLNATGQQDEAWWFARIAGLQEEILLDPLTRLVELILKAKNGPTKGVLPENWSIVFRPLKQESDMERADRMGKLASAHKTWIDAKVITPEEAAISAFGGDTFSDVIHIDKDRRKKLQDARPMLELPAPDLTATLAAWQQQGISFTEMRERLREAGIATLDDEKAKDEMEEAAASGGGMGGAGGMPPEGGAPPDGGMPPGGGGGDEGQAPIDDLDTLQAALVDLEAQDAGSASNGGAEGFGPEQTWTDAGDKTWVDRDIVHLDAWAGANIERDKTGRWVLGGGRPVPPNVAGFLKGKGITSIAGLKKLSVGERAALTKLVNGMVGAKPGGTFTLPAQPKGYPSLGDGRYWKKQGNGYVPATVPGYKLIESPDGSGHVPVKEHSPEARKRAEEAATSQELKGAVKTERLQGSTTALIAKLGAEKIKEHDAAARTRAKGWWKGLSEDQRAAVDDYRDHGWNYVNTFLRGGHAETDSGRAVDRDSGRLAKAVEKAIDGAPRLPKKTVVWRGIYDEELAGDPAGVLATRGNVISDKGFTSTSVDPKIARTFAEMGGAGTGVLMRITLPKGSRAAYLSESTANTEQYDGEKEYLLQRGARFNVTRIVKGPKTTILEAEYLGSKKPALAKAGKPGKPKRKDDDLEPRRAARFMWSDGDVEFDWDEDVDADPGAGSGAEPDPEERADAGTSEGAEKGWEHRERAKEQLHMPHVGAKGAVAAAALAFASPGAAGHTGPGPGANPAPSPIVSVEHAKKEEDEGVQIAWPAPAPAVSEKEVLSVLSPKEREEYDRILDEVQEAVEAGETSQERFMRPDGTYEPERAKEHDRIFRKLFENSERFRPPKGEQPTVVFLGGRGGSGKSSFETPPKGTLGVYDRSKFLVLDADAIKEMLPDYDPRKAFLWHEESSDLMKAATDLARHKGLNVVLDITMQSPNTPLRRVQEFKGSGYRVEAHYMYLPASKAAQRALYRWINPDPKDGVEQPKMTGRLVPPSIVLGMTQNERVFQRVAAHADKWSAYSNDVPRGQKPIKLSGKKAKGDAEGPRPDRATRTSLKRAGRASTAGEHRAAAAFHVRQAERLKADGLDHYAPEMQHRKAAMLHVAAADALAARAGDAAERQRAARLTSLEIAAGHRDKAPEPCCADACPGCGACPVHGYPRTKTRHYPDCLIVREDQPSRDDSFPTLEELEAALASSQVAEDEQREAELREAEGGSGK